ncbi:MAG: hypothetical protein ACR2PG_13650 [Hyphomicrobiaceae bacterium]
MSSIPEVREIEASAKLAAIYEDIKAASGLPQVNLIYRHLATVPGMLPKTWEILGPLYHGGHIAEASQRIVQVERNCSAELLPDCQDLPARERRDLAHLLNVYNIGNLQNLVALSALLEILNSPSERSPMIANVASGGATGKHDSSCPQDWHRSPCPGLSLATEAPIPRLPKLAALPPSEQKIVEDLAARLGGSDLGVTPSLYLHMALWPTALRCAHRITVSMIESGELANRIRDLRENVAEVVVEIQSFAGREVAHNVSPEHAAAMRTIETFVACTIPEMVILGRIYFRWFTGETIK